MARQNSDVVKLCGSTLACVGVAHLANPRMFTPLTRRAFPHRTRMHIYANGAAATTLGLGIRVPRTRALATIVAIGYGAHLAGRATHSARVPRSTAPRLPGDRP